MSHFRKTLLATSAVAIAVSFGAPAFAQTAPDRNEAQEADETVVVTGSRIRRAAENAPAPLIQLTQDDVLQSGEPNVIDFLADIPALASSTVPEDTTGANLNDGGLSLLNLRDLGSQRTLVLVDGRRHVGAPQGSLSVDVDSIPRLLVRSIEVTTGGQSAVYGADAVAGVVNYIMIDDFEGLDVDLSLAEINQGGQLSNRISALAGTNLLDDRLNLYVSVEYDANEEVLDSDVDWRRRGWNVIGWDGDPSSGQPDEVWDNALFANVRNISRARGGTLVIAGQPLPSPLTDPDIPRTACGAPGTTFGSNIPGASAACFALDANLGRTYVFDATGRARLANYGTVQSQTGISRALVVGGDGLNIGTEFSQGSRVGESEAYRFQGGFNFDVTDNIRAFGEYKFVREDTYDEGQPTFFDIGIASTPSPTALPGLFASSQFNVGIDNPYLDPAVRAAILANTRNVLNATTGAVTGTTADARALLRIFGPNRTQDNQRFLQRWVLGARGDIDQIGFVTDISWELGYTYGEVVNRNVERGVDVVRFYHSTDAVTDTAGVLGTPGAIVCRVRLLVAQGVNVTDPWNGGFYSATNPTVRNCTPQSLFGADLRLQTGQEASAQYYNAAITVKHTNEQRNLLGFVSGNLFDLWGAGPVGVSLGFETRNEYTGGVGRNFGTAGRFLFLNTGPDFAPAEYDATEFFAELKVPLFADMPFGEYAEISGAFRRSEYESNRVGSTAAPQTYEADTYSIQAQYRWNRSLMLRASLGEAVRIPSLSDAFSPATQTFANNFADPCDRNSINGQTTQIQGFRRANCAALLGANWSGDPTTGTLITYTSGIPGVNSGNPTLRPEESESFTASIVYTPTYLPGFSFVADYFAIEITNVIAAVTAQAAAIACVSGPSVNTPACSTFTRNGFIAANDPANFRVVDFIQGSINYAKQETSGVDFAFAWRDLDAGSLFGHDLGEFSWGLRGTYLLERKDFFSTVDPDFSIPSDELIGLPRVRFLQTITWNATDRLRLTWDWDWQSSQEITDRFLRLNDVDNRPTRFHETGDYSQHDISLRYDISDRMTFRAGVVNVFDADPVRWLTSTTTADNFDLFGRRAFIGLRYTH